MRPTLAMIAFLPSFSLASVPALALEDDAAALADAFRALRPEYNRTGGAFRAATTDEERNTAVERLGRLALRFVELAERCAADPLAIEIAVEAVRAMNSTDSLTQTAWETNSTSFPDPVRDDAAERTTALLRRHHLRSDALVLVCDRMSYGVRPELERFLRAALESNPHRDVRALACLSLARFLGTRAQKLDLIAVRPELAGRYEGLVGVEELGRWRRVGRERLFSEVESLLERAAAEFADIELPYGGTAGERAARELFELRHLAVGKTAPEIDGRDQDGRPLKLSDFRGKVVLLDFWSEF